MVSRVDGRGVDRIGFVRSLWAEMIGHGDEVGAEMVSRIGWARRVQTGREQGSRSVL